MAEIIATVLIEGVGYAFGYAIQGRGGDERPLHGPAHAKMVIDARYKVCCGEPCSEDGRPPPGRPPPPPPPAPVPQVRAPPGPVGLRFRGTTVAEVLPTSPLRGQVSPGYVLLTVNGAEATAESLLAARGVLELNDDGKTPRTLVFTKPGKAVVDAQPVKAGQVLPLGA